MCMHALRESNVHNIGMLTVSVQSLYTAVDSLRNMIPLRPTLYNATPFETGCHFKTQPSYIKNCTIEASITCKPL